MSELPISTLELKRAVVLRPDDPDARYALALRMFEEGRLEVAVRQLSEALARRPDFPDAAHLLSRAHTRAGRHDEARKALEALLRVRPQDAGVHDELAELFLQQGRWDDALLSLLGAARRQPHDARRYVKAAEIARARRLWERALDLLTRARAEERGNEAAAALLRTIAEDLGEPASAIEPEALLARLEGRQASSTTVGRIGVLGWTPVGGVVSPLEALAVPGKGELIFSGNLGPAIRDSCQVAFTGLKARAGSLGIESLIRTRDLHLNFTDAEAQKDGGSAGMALALAGTSAFLHKPLRRRLGATGAITLHGDVQRVDGIHEKLVASYLAGLTRVLLPRGNLRDAQHLPAEVRERVELVHVDTVADALGAALEP